MLPAPKRRKKPNADVPAASNRTKQRRAQVADEEAEAEAVAAMAGKEKAGRSRARVPRGGVANALKDTEPDDRPNMTLRIGKRWTQIVTEVADGQYTWAEFTEELDPEELARGQLKDRRGTFRGRPPAMVPSAFHHACLKEIQRRFNEKIQTRLLDAVDELIDLSKAGSGMDGKDRAKVLQYLIERVMGSVPKTVNVTTDQPWEGMVAQGLFRPAVDGTPASPPARSDRYAKRRRTLDPSEDKDE